MDKTKHPEITTAVLKSVLNGLRERNNPALSIEDTNFGTYDTRVELIQRIHTCLENLGYFD